MIIIVFWKIKEETKNTKRQRYVKYLNIGGNQLWGGRRNNTKENEEKASEKKLKETMQSLPAVTQCRESG